MTLTRSLAAAITGLTLALAPVAVVPAIAQAEEAQIEIDDALLTAFATAAIDVAEVSAKYQAEFEAAENEAAQQAVIEEAQAEMVAAVEATEGVTLEEYMAISQQASQDSDLDQRIRAIIADSRQEG
jgi:hypothetical protein